MSGISVGIDIGGTFTDLVLLDERTRETVFGKELTTHDDPSRGMLDGLEKLLNGRGLGLADLHRLVHATTLVTNAIIERRGARVGLIATKGFRDTLEIGAETRYQLYDLFFQKPEPLVARPQRLEVAERIDAGGRIVQPLDERDVEAVAALFKAASVEAVAVCLLHSYRNPVHERRVGAMLQSLLPDIPVTLSSDVAPEIREYERANTAAANAYVQPLVGRYLSKLSTALEERGFTGAIQLMLSGGGLTTVKAAQAQPVQLIESGPAAGAIAAGHFSQGAGIPQVISFDMGGTTAKMCLLQDGKPGRAHEFEAARVERFRKGSGLPLKVSVIDLIEIGAGGGSIAHVNAMGLLKVGPQSAGSMPGPACYGRGGTQPTVTDADLVLGYLSRGYFLGGEMGLDIEASRRVIAEHVAGPLGLDVITAAAGIHAVVTENMASATRMYLAEKGMDPRDHTLLAFGGAGPVHAYGLARRLNVPKMLVPPGAGVMSALGLLAAAPAVDITRSHAVRLASADWTAIEGLFAAMEAEARGILGEAGVAAEDIVMTRSADMRFIGQGFEVPTPLPSGALAERAAAAIEAGFIDAYEKLFGRRVDGVGVEVMTWRLHAGVTRPPSNATLLHPVGLPTVKARRAVHFEGHGFLDCAVYDRHGLPSGTVLAGPVIIEERESTTVIGPNATVEVDEAFNLVVLLG